MATTTIEQLLTRCEREPLHLIGAIQPHGTLLQSDHDGIVRFVGANLEPFLGISPQEALGQPLAGLLPDLDVKAIEGLEASHEIWFYGYSKGAIGLIDLCYRRTDRGLLIELLLSGVMPDLHPYGHNSHLPELLKLPDSVDSVNELLQKAVQQMRRISGFERVMVYRFREDWSGEVVAESGTEQMGSFLGLRFPASDIPTNARQLYADNPLRLIPDRQAEAVRILADQADEVLDLHYAHLRSVSPLHLEYLANMGVVASMSLAIIVQGRLWGLFACHHPTARQMAPAQYPALLTLSRSCALTISIYQTQAHLHFIDSVDRHIDLIVKRLSNENYNIATGSDSDEEARQFGKALLALVAADGVLLCGPDYRYSFGCLPADHTLRQLAEQLQQHATPFLCYDDISEWLPMLPMGDVSGMMSVQLLGRANAVAYCYWFRLSQPQRVQWAGEPCKRVKELNGVEYLSPRQSFARWSAELQSQSEPWSRLEQLAGKKFRNIVLRWLLHHH